MIVQVLPFASEETLQQLEVNITSVPSVTEMLHQGLTAKEIAHKLLHNMQPNEQGFSLTPT